MPSPEPSTDLVAATFEPQEHADFETLREGCPQYDEMRAKLAVIAAAPGELTRMQAEIAKDFDSAAIKRLDAIEDSPIAALKKRLFQRHRLVSAAMQLLTQGPSEVRQYASRIAVRWNREEMARAEADRIAREAAANKQQEDDRLAQAAELEQQGFKQEAHELLNEPLVPVAMPVARDAGKLAGMSIVKSWTVESVQDPVAFVKWLAQNEDHVAGLDVEKALKKSYWKGLLTPHKGRLQIPGLRIVETEETRHRAK
jgi:hypothetical protein